MVPIRLLPPEVTARIAAGEVVERPASAVKELVENALDAGATSVAVEVKGGGVTLLRITDDGCGIPADEVPLALERHATSKVAVADDLDAIGTLGFRGEALHAISAVSLLTVTTRTHDADVGLRYSVRWGEHEGRELIGCAPGTTITVQELFGNTPARRNFLRSATAEASRIADTVSHLALAHPEVRFRLVVEGRTTLSTPGSGSLREAVAAVYGVDVAHALLDVSAELEGYTLLGLASPPSLTRANRGYQSFFVNGRWIYHRALSVALEEAYQHLLQQGRYPVAVLHLALPPADLDVNVHPSTREVRFRQEGRAFRLVQQGVRGALLAFSPVQSVNVPSLLQPTHPTSLSNAAPAATSALPTLSPPALSAPPPAATPRQAMPLLRVFGQVEQTYVVAEGPDGVYLIDQHAAHERILFEQVKAQAAGRTPAQQALLEPWSVTLTPRQEALLAGSREALEGLGFGVEPFGERTWLVRAVPAVLPKRESAPGHALVAVLDLMAGEQRVSERGDLAAASIACHGAVRAGMTLGILEMVELVRQLEQTASPHTCPHGRPTMVHLSSRHLEREFGRR